MVDAVVKMFRQKFQVSRMIAPQAYDPAPPPGGRGCSLDGIAMMHFEWLLAKPYRQPGGRAIIARIAGGDGTMPAEVLALILDDNLSPVAAWRRYRGLSQAELAGRAGLSQVWISRIEAGGGHGSPATRRKLAKALEAPLWALEGEEQG